MEERKNQRIEEETQLIRESLVVEKFRGKLPGSWLYFFRGYLYTKDGRKRRRETLPTILRCSNSTKFGCREIIKISRNSDEVINPDKQYDHICGQPNYRFRREQTFRESLCKKARESFQPLREIFDDIGSDEGE